MSDAIIVALISASVTLIGVIINTRTTQQKMMLEIDKKLAVLDTTFRIQIDDLSAEVKEHNNYARRLPVAEEQIRQLAQRVDRIEKRPSA
ncbi:MAG: hypothetical protein II008_09200 [Oscillospiraceae bacterium]|nr:hypothetical protein [Oscillospiraceae bacterium]